MKLSRATAEALELPSLLALLAHLTASDLGSAVVFDLLPCADEDALRRRRQAYQEVERLVAARPLVPLLETPVRPLLAALSGGPGELDGRDLVVVGDFLEAGAEAANRIAEADPPCSELASRLAELPSTEELRRRIRKTLDGRGQIREDASPLLRELRQRIRGVRNRVYDQLGAIVEAERDNLSEETIPLRGGRLVLVLQAGARGRIPGLVHGRSGSGKSFYFEPLAAVELNNQLQQAVEDEEAEKRRLLAELLQALRDASPVLAVHAELVAELDFLQAAVRYGEVGRGRLADLSERHDLVLRGARHPLLDPAFAELRLEALHESGHREAVVPLDLDLAAERRALVVTGPNAGGKTVVLKTLGLAALAHQCGLPVLAEAGSRVPRLAALVATVGDDQDLLADRSTFSGRLLRLREAFEEAGPDALILLDELGSGTDPEEGAALSTALLEGLVERRALALVTTHLGPVAAAALELDGAGCAAMQFDPATGAPTYRLLPGPPGGSEALALARRLGLPAAWLDRAEALLGSEHRDLRRLLAELERTRGELEAAHQRLATELADAELLRRRLAEEEAAAVAERKTAAKALAQELRLFKDEATRRLRDEVDRVRRATAEGRRKGVVAEAVERLFEDAPALDAVARDAVAEGAAVVGGEVRHRALGWTGTLEKVERGRAQVRVRGKVLHCAAGDLVGLLAAAPEAAPKRRGPRPGEGGAGTLDEAEVGSELHLIGQRVEPALEELDRFLDRALLAAHAAVRIVHGHGSGRLRAAVREHLRGHPAVRRHHPAPPDQGGNGATVVELASG